MVARGEFAQRTEPRADAIENPKPRRGLNHLPSVPCLLSPVPYFPSRAGLKCASVRFAGFFTFSAR